MTSTTSVLARTLSDAFEAENGMSHDQTEKARGALHVWPTSRIVREILTYIDTGELPQLPDDDQRADSATPRERLTYLYDRRNGLTKAEVNELRNFSARYQRLIPQDSDVLRRVIEIDLQPRPVSGRNVG